MSVQQTTVTNKAQHPPCSLLRRLAAMLYDALLVIALLMVAAAVVVIPAGAGVKAGTFAFQLYLLIVWWAYFAVCWRMGGQTVGMKAWRVKLITQDGQRISWPVTVLRFVVAAFSAAALGLGYIWSLWSAQRRSWHDMATSTRLVVMPKVKDA